MKRPLPPSAEELKTGGFEPEKTPERPLDTLTFFGKVLDVVLPMEIVSPDYAIVRFTDEIYKIVRFNRSNGSPFLGRSERPQKSPEEKNEEKLSASLSRTRRVIMEYGLCNRWDYFMTCTQDANKRDRHDLKQFRNDLEQFVRDCRKRYGQKVQVVLIPEKHKDGAWHMHGLISGLPAAVLSDFDPAVHPLKICNRGFKNWQDYADRFGFCSLSPIKDPVRVGMYITKYVTKDLCQRKGELGSHLYFSSQGLMRAQKVSEVIGNCSELNSFLTHHYQFVSTGLTKPSDGLDWSFPLQYDNTTVYLEAFPMGNETSRETRKLDRMSETVIQTAMIGFDEVEYGGI